MRKTIMRSLGEFVGHIWHAAAKDPDPDKERTVVRHEVEESERDTPGGKVTLRRNRMYEFVDRLINVALPRVRDFRGLNRSSFDGRGNFAMGIKEHIVFPEINYDEVDEVWGMDVVVTTTAKSDDEARALLKAFNFPFRQ